MTEVVSSILGSLVEKLTSLATEEIQLVCGVKDDREKLKNTLEMIQMVLADAEQRQTKENVVRLWLSRLKNWCYDAEDALDEFEARALWRRVRSIEHLTLKRKVRYLYSWISEMIFQFKMAHNMKELRKSLDGIDKDETRFTLSTNVHERTIVPRRETHSFVPASNVIGRNEEKESIIEWLRSDAEAIKVYSIIGMGGAGKTTLVRLVYNDKRVEEHFKNNQVWLSMPQEFKIQNIIRDIIKSLSGVAEVDNYNLEALQNHLRNLVKNRRCLFVMDDVWAMSMNDWLELTILLEGLSKGSKVILTSRNQAIAKNMGTDCLLYLANLSLEDSLTLFVKYAFDQGQEKNHPDLMEIGKEIVKKCGGNPMALRALGCLLYSKNNRSDWEHIRDSETWQLTNTLPSLEILPSLRISYDLMPSYLKQCFAYCSIFPKNHEFNNFELIELWISNGFIQSSGNNQELEEIGRQYLEELLSRSFFIFLKDIYPFLYFEMHDLIYELAISVAQTESSNMKVWTQDISPTIRHVSFPDLSGVPKDELSGCFNKPSRIRTIMCQKLGSSDSEEFFLETCILRFKHLRVLWLEESSFNLLPSSIGDLKLLRYLKLSDGTINKLPKSVYELCNLQILDLAVCQNLEELSADIKNMINLRALYITTKQKHFPESGIGRVTSLRRLCIWDCRNLEALFDDIQSLTSLRMLRIGMCRKLASLPQGIKNLKALEDLYICACGSLRLPEGDGNEPGSMSSLQSLVLSYLPELVSLPGWLEGSASTLRTIEISYCPKLSALPEWLQNCSSLTKLQLTMLPELSSLPDGVRLIPTLKISECEKLSS
ncbi:hypothetical protein EUGRSUZ_A02516 [Eucalyptus grandis]|uniref:AAA+ ATPase domain-containing protein n=2 Tax=Eucalyptus grandis TaxID=71139 RepID=A0A059DJ42_EUCGR|nr:hypothetical protein EUGRSUZ_A02516 [Eucalyptus grandis]